MGVQKVLLDEDAPSPSMIIPIGTERYLSTNRFGGDYCKMPVLSFWNKDFSSQQIVKGRFMNDGIHFPDAFFVGEEGRVDWGPTFAAITVTVIPTLFVYEGYPFYRNK